MAPSRLPSASNRPAIFAYSVIQFPVLTSATEYHTLSITHCRFCQQDFPRGMRECSKHISNSEGIECLAAVSSRIACPRRWIYFAVLSRANRISQRMRLTS